MNVDYVDARLRDLQAFAPRFRRPEVVSTRSQNKPAADPQGKYLRGLEEIGRHLCGHKPFGLKTVRRLIRDHGLPARRLPQLGWVVRVERLDRWAEEFFDGLEERQISDT